MSHLENNTIAVILGGGRGTRLFPLTMRRSKPAVPFAGKYRLVDIPISNCINSGFRKIYLLTQFNSASLHNHISQTYRFDSFTNGFVEILAAEQTPEDNSWYQGTADAVRKNLTHFDPELNKYVIILSGDQLYRMDFKKMLDYHIQSKSEITIAGKVISREEATGLGIIGADSTGKIKKFFEKPSPEEDISSFKAPSTLLKKVLNIEHQTKENEYIANMGIYIFNMDCLVDLLNNKAVDFGKEVIPMSLSKKTVKTYLFDGFWEDIGTIKAFYDVNLDLASISPQFNFYDENHPIFTQKKFLPATKINACNFHASLACEGSIITNAQINRSVIGLREVVEDGANLDGVYCMGASFYETKEEKEYNKKINRPNIGIGKFSVLRKTIVDKNVRIGEYCRIGSDKINRLEGDFGNYSIHDGIIVIHKGATIPNGTII